MHFMTVCLASLLFPPLIWLPSGRVALENPQGCFDRSRTSENVEWVLRVAQYLTLEMTGVVLSPLSAHHFRAGFWCGSFSSFTIWGLPKASTTEYFRILIYAFWELRLRLLLLDLCTFFQNFNRSPLQLRNSASLGSGSNFKQEFWASRDDCGSVLFLTPNQTAGPLSNHNSRVGRCQREEV